MHMSDAPLQRDGKAVTRSRSLQRLRDSVFSGASIFLIVLGFVVCSLNAYNMGYVNAKLVMAPMLRELARFQLLVKGHSACVIPGICARLRTTLSNYDSAEEAEGLKWAQAVGAGRENDRETGRCSTNGSRS